MQLPRYIEDDDCPKLLCKVCNDYYPFEDYYNCPKCHYGKMTKCKWCWTEEKRQERGAVISDRDIVLMWFKKMGYDISDLENNSIHTQFIKKQEEKRKLLPPQEPKPPKKKIKEMTREEYNEYQKQIKLKNLKKHRK